MTLSTLIQRKSEQFELLYPDLQLPLFWWLQVLGRAGEDDFGIGPSGALVVSPAALSLIETFHVEFLFHRPFVAAT